MKFKIMIVDEDEKYLERLSAVFKNKFSSRMQLSCFSSAEIAVKESRDIRFDLIIIDENIEVSAFSSNNIVYFVDEIGRDSFNGLKAISKYQNASSIYSEILACISELSDNKSYVADVSDRAGDTNVIAFTSFSGGVGVTSVSVAAAEYLTQRGYSVMYLNMGLFSDPGLFFINDGQQNISNVIFALKSKKTNLALKIESAFSHSFSGIAYFAKPNMSVDISEISSEEWARLIDELKDNLGFDYIILDTERCFDFSDFSMSVFERADKIVIVNDGSAISNSKFEMAYNSLFTFENDKNKSLVDKMLLMYNKFSSKTSLELSNIDIKCIGGISRIDSNEVSAVKFIKEYGEIFEKLI